jgi:SAM-dependent methyltransferase
LLPNAKLKRLNFAIAMMVKDFWDSRFSQPDYFYGVLPNTFFRSAIEGVPAGRLLVPGAGEGRDAVFAAELGWKVEAFDLSEAGQRKAARLAKERGVTIEYAILDAVDFNAQPNSYDAIAIIFFHLPSAIRSQVFLELAKSLRMGGKLIVQLFHQEQLGSPSGGPKEIDMLYHESFIEEDFPNVEVERSLFGLTWLQEGDHHSGEAFVTSFVGTKTKE